jgi:hypothetical protein
MDEVILRMAAFVSVAFAAASCGGGDGPEPEGPATVVQMRLGEYTIVPDVDPVNAGPIVFELRNSGPTKEHELYIIRTDLAPDGLPTKDDGSADLDDLDVVSHVGSLRIGNPVKVNTVVEPGRYVLICNLVDDGADGSPESHYAQRMHSVLTAVAPTPDPMQTSETPWIP